MLLIQVWCFSGMDIHIYIYIAGRGGGGKLLPSEIGEPIAMVISNAAHPLGGIWCTTHHDHSPPPLSDALTQVGLGTLC